MDYEDLENLAEDLDNRVSALEDLDLEDYQNNNDQVIQDLQTNEGQLTFPLSQDTIDLINEQFPRGSVTLGTGGTYILNDSRISTTSTIIYSVTTPSGIPVIAVGDSHLYYSVTLGAGTATFQSSLGADRSTLSYLLLP